MSGHVPLDAVVMSCKFMYTRWGCHVSSCTLDGVVMSGHVPLDGVVMSGHVLLDGVVMSGHAPLDGVVMRLQINCHELIYICSMLIEADIGVELLLIKVLTLTSPTVDHPLLPN